MDVEANTHTHTITKSFISSSCQFSCHVSILVDFGPSSLISGLDLPRLPDPGLADRGGKRFTTESVCRRVCESVENLPREIDE